MDGAVLFKASVPNTFIAAKVYLTLRAKRQPRVPVDPDLSGLPPEQRGVCECGNIQQRNNRAGCPRCARLASMADHGNMTIERDVLDALREYGPCSITQLHGFVEGDQGLMQNALRSLTVRGKLRRKYDNGRWIYSVAS